MLKRQASIFVLASLTVLGAGCSSAPVATIEKAKVETPSEQVAVPTPVDTVENNPITPPPAMQEENGALKFPGILPAAETEGKFVRLMTTKGDIWFEVLPKEGPKAASNFVYLAKRKFYDGLTFHRVVPGFVIQGGDPSGNGTGGPGYQFEDDVVNLPYNEGIVAMANAGPNTNGSQFFIMLADNPLPPSYSVFGRVVKGMDVVKKISVGDKMTTVSVESTKP